MRSRIRRGRAVGLMCGWMGSYRANTPGTKFLPNTTTILGEDSEPEPDGALVIVGGRTHENEDDYLVGPPELTGEVASSSASYDLQSKRRDYESDRGPAPDAGLSHPTRLRHVLSAAESDPPSSRRSRSASAALTS